MVRAKADISITATRGQPQKIESEKIARTTGLGMALLGTPGSLSSQEEKATSQARASCLFTKALSPLGSDAREHIGKVMVRAAFSPKFVAVVLQHIIQL